MTCKHLCETLFSMLLEIYSVVEFLGHMIILLLIFLMNCHTVFQAVPSFYIPKNSSQGVEFLHILTNTCTFCISFFLIFIVIQLQLSAFSPHPSTPPQQNPPPSPASTLPLDFVHVSFIVVPVNPSPHCPLPTPLWLLLDCS